MLKSGLFVLYKTQFIVSWRNRVLSSYSLDFLFIECKIIIFLILLQRVLSLELNCCIFPLFFYIILNIMIDSFLVNIYLMV